MTKRSCVRFVTEAALWSCYSINTPASAVSVGFRCPVVSCCDGSLWYVVSFNADFAKRLPSLLFGVLLSSGIQNLRLWKLMYLCLCYFPPSAEMVSVCVSFFMFTAEKMAYHFAQFCKCRLLFLE